VNPDHFEMIFTLAYQNGLIQLFTCFWLV